MDSLKNVSIEDHFLKFQEEVLRFKKNEGTRTEVDEINLKDVKSRKVNFSFVTLTFAQSLDGSISLAKGKPYTLSGKKSLILTHKLRSLHKAIVVGLGTVIADDPQLTVRECEGQSPRPVIIDTFLNCPCNRKILKRNPIIVCCESEDDSKLFDGKYYDRKKKLEEAGATILCCKSEKCEDHVHVNMEDMIEKLNEVHNLDTIMIEGGAGIISSFLSSQRNFSLCDCLIITICPVLMGGYRYLNRIPDQIENEKLPSLKDPSYFILGKDIVVFEKKFTLPNGGQKLQDN